MDEVPLRLPVTRLDDRLPPALVRHADDPSAEALDRGELRLGRALRDDDRGRDAELARHPGDSLRHVARARRHDSALDGVAGRLPDRVRGAADLERADRLQVLELEPDLGSRGNLRPVQAYERRAQGNVGDRLARALDLGERDQSSTSVPTPSFAGAADAELARREILDGEPQRLEDRQLVVRAAPRVRADEHLAELGPDVLRPDPGLLDREQVVAGLR